MPCFFKESGFVKFVFKLIVVFSLSYNNSGLKRKLKRASDVYRASTTRAVLRAYLYKRPWYMDSCLFKLLSKAAAGIAVLCGFVNKLFTAVLKGSLVKEQLMAFKNEKRLIWSCLALLFMAAALSYLSVSVYLGINTETRFFVSWGLFLTGALCAIIEIFVDIIQKSFVFRFFKDFFE